MGSENTNISSVPREAPRLWNPNAAASWSLLFSPIFGAILHMKNWEALGEPAKAAQAKSWAIVSVIFLVVVILASVALPDSKAIDLLSRVAGLALLLGWYYSSGKPQVAYILARYGKSYPRRGWAKPLLFAFLALLGLVLVSVVVGFVAGVLAGAA